MASQAKCISCGQDAILSPRSWKVTISGDGADRQVELSDPFDSDGTEGLVRWYLEDFTNEPFAQSRAQGAAERLQRYVSLLWGQLEVSPQSSPDTTMTIDLSIVVTPGQDGIDRLHWELLENLSTPSCRIIVHRELRDDSSCTDTIQLPRHDKSVKLIPVVFRILIVSARSNVRADVTPRLTSLPLLRTLGRSRRLELIFTHTGTFDEFEKALDGTDASNTIHLVHFDMHGRVDRNKGPVLEFTDPALRHRTAHPASTVAQVLERNEVKWTVLCACRAAQTTTSAFSHLALQFLNCGITGVFAMRYELKATAAKILTSSFYSALCSKGKTFIEAAHAARHQMRKDTSRLAKFGEVVEMDDSLVPPVYTINGADFRLDTSLENRPQALSDEPWLLPEVVGREHDIRRIGSLLRGDMSFLLLKGDIGTGKSLLMRHLAWWWTEIRLFKRVMHVKVSLADAEADGVNDVGLMRVAKCIWRSVTGNTNTASSDHNNPIAYLVEAMNTIKGQDSVILLDGLDEMYHVLSISEDTTEAWSNFFCVAKLLSTTSSKFLVATCAPLLCTGGEPTDDIFAMSRTMSTEDARRLVSTFHLQAQEGGQLDEPPDSHLLRVFDVLQYNPMVLKTYSSVLGEKFHGLERILAWNAASSKDSAEGTLYMQQQVGRLADLSTMDLEDSQGLGRVHFLMLTILNYLARHGRYQDILAVISIGLWTHTMPHPDAMRDMFATANPVLQLNTNLLRTLVDGISGSQVVSSTVPLELWLVMKERPPVSAAPAFSAESFVESVKHVLPLLTAAKLLTEPTEPLIDGRRGWHTHPALTLWLRRILRVLSLSSLFHGFAQCMEDRAVLMAGLNPGVTEHVAAIRSPSFPFVLREHWNLMTAVVGTFQIWRVARSAISLIPSAARAQFPIPIPTGSLFAWNSFSILAPICATTEDFCTSFLAHIALDYIDAVAPHVSSNLDRELEEPLGPLLYLVNWAIDMSQRYSLTERQALPSRIRKLILARVDNMRATGIGTDQLNESNFVAAEFKASLSELRIAARSPNATEADIDRWAERLERLHQGPVDAWGLAGRALDDILNLRSILNQGTGLITPESIREWRQERSRRAREADAAAHGAGTEDNDELLATQNLIIDSMVDGIASLQSIRNTANPLHNSLLFELIRFMDEDLDYATGMPPWYLDLVTPIFTHTRDGNLALAAAAARRALATADRDGHVLLATKFRRVCRWLGEMDAAGDDYEVCRALLLRSAAFTVPFLRNLLVTYLAEHDTPGAYQHAVQARDDLRLVLVMGLSQAPGPIQESGQGDGGEGFAEPLHPFATGALANIPQLKVSLEGLEKLIGLLAPYKDERLEDKGEWVRLVGEIRRVLRELEDESRTMDMAWVLETRSMLNDPAQFANLTNELLGGLETNQRE